MEQRACKLQEGEIVGICKYYKEYEEYKKVKLKNPKEAFKEVKKGKASNNIDPNAKEAKIKNVQLAYWEDGGGINEQPHLQPVWIFEGESIDDNNEISKFDAIVPAIEQQLQSYFRNCNFTCSFEMYKQLRVCTNNKQFTQFTSLYVCILSNNIPARKQAL